VFGRTRFVIATIRYVDQRFFTLDFSYAAYA